MLKSTIDHIPSLSGRLLFFTVVTSLIMAVLTGCAGASGINTSSEKQKTFVLYGNEDPDDLEILKQRLDLFAGKNGYSLEQTAGTFTLRLPASLCRSSRLLNGCITYFLVSPCHMNITYDPSDSSSYSVYTAAKLTRENCLSMKVVELPVENEIEAGDSLLTLDMDTPPSRRLILELSQETADSLRSLISCGGKLYIAENNIYPNSLLFNSYGLEADPDESCLFYIDYNETDCLYNNENLFFFNLTHEPLAHPFRGYSVDEIVWEDPEENTTSGAYQCRTEALEDSYLFFMLYHGALSEQFSQLKMLLLRRLDLLQSPYAYGQTDDGSICVKIQSSRINRTILSLLIPNDNSPITLKVPGSKEYLRPKYLHVQYNAEKSALEVSLSSEDASELNDMLQAQMQSPAGAKVPFQQIPIYLCVDGTPVSRCTTDVFFNPELLIFREIFMSVSDEDIPWFAALLEEAANQRPESYLSVYLDYFYAHENDEDFYDSSVTFPLQQWSPFSEAEIAAKMQKILPTAQVQLSEDSSNLRIHMNLPVDENLVSNIFSLVPDLLKASALNKEYYDSVQIYPFEPEGDERCWLTFDRHQDGTIHFSGLLYNGRLTPYKEEIEKAIKEDTFFKTMILSEYDGWYIGVLE